MNQTIDVDEVPPSAEALRMTVLQKEMEKVDAARKEREAEERRLSEFARDFLHNHVGEKEMAMVRRLVMNAVKDGKFEAMIYSFPSRLCTDSGRAINNSDPRWPETLQGKAKELYASYEELGKPRGYKLTAMVINFPDGIPGDIGFFLNWAPPAV
ncbi:histidine kinase [Mesorhizobium sp. KR9-304]|uniref:histidine kinase n=1 Tax=Mesorhizobium sp. KR9-304 TaxID=3156614 RepID=UPI0032B412C3